MAELEKIDFEKVVEKLLLSQYKKPNMQSVFKIISEIFDDIQDDNFELRDKFWLTDATGEQLDFIGRLWDETRTGQNDDDYRARIYDKIALTLSGTIQEIKSYIISVYGASYVIYSPEYPGKYRIRTDVEIPQSTMEKISPAGVLGFVSGSIVDASGNNIVDAEGNHIIHVDG
jgi:hypothetical protein